MSHDEWALALVDEDLELPGWLFVPRGLSSDEQEQWMSAALAEMSGTVGWDGQPTSDSDAREVLAAALERRAASESLAMLQVWPTLGHDAVMCHVDILSSEALPEWTETDAVVHPIEAPHIGPGLQCSTLRTLQVDDDLHLELSSVHFIFDDGEVTLMLSLEEAIAPLIAIAMPAFVLLMQNLRMVRGAERVPFASVPPQGVLDEAPWQFEGTA